MLYLDQNYHGHLVHRMALLNTVEFCEEFLDKSSDKID